MIEQEVTCEGDLFPLCHDFCLAALDLAIDTFFRTCNLQGGATKFYLRTIKAPSNSAG